MVPLSAESLLSTGPEQHFKLSYGDKRKLA